MFDRDHLPEPLPFPAVLTPLLDSASNAFTDVTAFRHERYMCRTIERFQASHDRKQLQPFAANERLDVIRRQTPRSVIRADLKSPMPNPLLFIGLGKKNYPGA